MDSRLAESFFNLPSRCPKVLGRRLRPFTLWHSFMLSAFSAEGASVYATLSLAVRICSRPPGALYRSPSGFDRWREKRVARWLARHPALLLREVEAFRAYREQWSAGPRIWSSRDSLPAKCHWALFVSARLVRYGHLSWAQAWASPVGRALWLSSALAEANGAKINVMSEAEFQALRDAGYTEEELA